MKTLTLNEDFKKISYSFYATSKTQSSNSKTCAWKKFHLILKMRNKNEVALAAITIIVVSGRRMNKDRDGDIQWEKTST